TAIARASLNIPGPIPSEPKSSVVLANALGGWVFPPRAVGPFLVDGGGGGVTTVERTRLSSGTRNPPMAIAPITTAISGISTINKMILVALVPLFRRSILTCEIIWAGRPLISSGTDKALLQ